MTSRIGDMRKMTRAIALLAALCALAVAALAGAPAASAAGPSVAWWGLFTNTQPTYLKPGAEGAIAIKATNLGSASVEASPSKKVTVTDELPAGLEIGALKPVIC